MSDVAAYLDPQLLGRLHGLRLRPRRVVEGSVSGLHRSPYHGFSIEFAEHREYASGDDLRYLDWKVFGRTDKYYLKEFEEETNLHCYLALDVSESMTYRGECASYSKFEYAKRLAAGLAYVVLRQQDSAGLATFDQDICGFVRAAGGSSHIQDLLLVMNQASATRATATGTIFHELAERLKKRGVVVVLSDLFDELDSMMAGLRHLRHRRHEVIVMHVLDPSELDFPFQSLTMFRGLEQGPRTIVEPRALRKAYLAEFGQYLRRLREGCRAHQVDYVQMRTDQPVETALAHYLASRS